MTRRTKDCLLSFSMFAATFLAFLLVMSHCIGCATDNQKSAQLNQQEHQATAKIAADAAAAKQSAAKADQTLAGMTTYVPAKLTPEEQKQFASDSTSAHAALQDTGTHLDNILGTTPKIDAISDQQQATTDHAVKETEKLKNSTSYKLGHFILATIVVVIVGIGLYLIGEAWLGTASGGLLAGAWPFVRKILHGATLGITALIHLVVTKKASAAVKAAAGAGGSTPSPLPATASGGAS